MNMNMNMRMGAVIRKEFIFKESFDSIHDE